jgi:hypothetical protein
MKEEYLRMTRAGARTKDVLDKSIRQHATIIKENATDFEMAFELLKLLEPDVKSRVKHYSYCISKSTDSYLEWLREEYMRKLRLLVRADFE